MTKTQKTLLLYGVPIVAVLGLVALLRSRSATPAATGTTSPNNNAIGVDQLAAFENQVQGEIQNLAGTLQAAPPPNSTPSTPKPSGYGQVNVGGTSYTLLGIETAHAGQAVDYAGYQVHGGAPVFFLAPGSSTPTQGLAQAVSSAEVLVPSIYNSLVTPVPYSSSIFRGGTPTPLPA